MHQDSGENRPAEHGNMARLLPIVLFGIYLSVAAVCIARLIVGLVLTHRLIRRAREIQSVTISVPRRGRIRLLESNSVHVPATVGVIRPVVLLPADWREWGESKLQSVLAHELAHVRRADWLVITLAELNRALYWFHPVAWILRRRLSELAELNCDDAVLEAAGDRTQYARYLLEVASSLTSAGSRYRPLHGVAMARKPNVETRIDAILDVGRPLARRLGVLGVICLLAIGIPAILLAAALRTAADDPAQMQNGKSNQTSTEKVDNGKTTDLTAPTAKPATNATTSSIKVHGHVLDDHGAAVADARVVATQSRWLDGQYLRTEHRTVGETRSAADGSFEIAVPRVDPVDFRKNRFQSFDWKPPAIMAIDSGRLSTWAGGGEMPIEGEHPFDGDVVLRLSQPSHKIQGRLVSLEGQPLAGVSVGMKMLAIAEPDKIDKWLATVERRRKEGSLPKPITGPTGNLFISSMVWDSSANNNSNAAEISPYFPIQSRLLPEHPQFPAAVRTDVDGRFEIDNLPSDSLASLEISGPGVATHAICVLNRDIERIDIPNTGYPGAESNGYYGSKFDHPVEPGTEIVGTVKDKETGQPLAGIRVSAEIVVNQMGTRTSPWASETDKDGRFRIDGLPSGGKKLLDLYPGKDQPYLVSRGIEVQTASGAKPAETEIKLHRGMFARGKVTDAETGAPADAVVQYRPLLSNESARDFGYDPNLIHFDLVDASQRTNEKGEFQTVVIPGRGVLSVQCVQTSEYCVGLGSDKIELKADGLMATYNFMSPKFFNCVAEIDVPASAEVVHHDFQISHGQNVTINVQDPQGQPIRGVRASGLAPRGMPDDGGSSTSSLEFKALAPGETRRVLLLHKERRLGLITTVSASEKAAGNSPRTVTLQPCGIVIGRVVNGEGKPAAGMQFNAMATPPRDFDVVSPQQVASDAEGKFRFEYLPVGAVYNIGGFNPESGYIELSKELKFEPGETVDLGTIDVTSKKRPEPTRTQAANGRNKSTTIATASETENVSMHATSDSQRQKIHGRITGADGKPTAGANVAAIAMRVAHGRGGDLEPPGTVLGESQTDADGRYQIELPVVSSKTHLYPKLIARAGGSALAWKALNLDAVDTEASFELQPEQPVTGRLVDIEGQPAAGVQLRVAGITPRVAGDQSPFEGVGFFEARQLPAAWPQPIVTDDKGSFSIGGIPKDHGLLLQVEGTERFAPQSLSLNTGMSEQRGERDGTYRPQVVKNLKAGDEAVLALAPAQLFTGTVRFEDTGAPAPHARLTIWASQQEFGSMMSVAGQADEKGQYKISPNPGIRFGVTAYPPDGTPYLARELEPIDWKSGDRSRAVDVKLPRGVLVRGQVLEQGSDAPIAEASIQYHSEDEKNPKQSEGVVTGWQDIHVTDAQGHFEIVVLPGPGRLMVHAPHNDFVFQETSERELYSGSLGGRRNYAHAIERIEPVANARPVELTVHLQRGAAVRGELVDAEGAVIKNAVMLSRLNIYATSPFWRGFPQDVLDGKFEITGLAPDKEYPIYFLESKRRLGATLTAKAGMDAPRVVLQSCGGAKMRFVDDAGKPVANYEPSIFFVVTLGGLQYDRKGANEGKLAADSDFVQNIDRANHSMNEKADVEGRLTMSALIPGATYQIATYRKQSFDLGKEFQAKAGETMDLGDIVVERPE
jgi:beta-lactamase regulating signal transducer with metallopeptidase domain